MALNLGNAAQDLPRQGARPAALSCVSFHCKREEEMHGLKGHVIINGVNSPTVCGFLGGLFLFCLFGWGALC